METETANTNWAVITPSYRGDLKRCEILCRSMDAFVSGSWHHYIIVEKGDLTLFQPLASSRRTILQMEKLLPRSIYHLTRIPFINHRSLWFSWRTGFMIGWHIQQIIKLEMAFRLKETGLLYCDSDVFFVRHFDAGSLIQNSQFRFYRTDYSFLREQSPNVSYIEASAKQLGLGEEPFPCPIYIDNLVAWHAPTVRALCGHLELVSKRKWQFALGRNYIISEYSLYGMFVDRILNEKSALFGTGLQLCKTAWKNQDFTGSGLEEFCNQLEPQQVAVGFQSFLNISEADLDLELDKAIVRAQSHHAVLE
jgi:Family of unknown function (DUF6492)